jgi:hypothetical protein
MKIFGAIVVVVALRGVAQAGYFECGVCQSLLHFWSNARVESTFDQVCDAFPNYVNMYPNYKTGKVEAVQEKDAPKDKAHGLPVTHMERCRRVMDTMLIRLAEDGIVQVKDSKNAQVFAPTTWENPAILEILCTYVYPKLGSGYCKGEFGGSVDDNCKFVESRITSLPTNSDNVKGTIVALGRARDLGLLEGRFLACRDFLDICNEHVDDAQETLTYSKLQKQFTKAYDPYWAARNFYKVPLANASFLGTKAKKN